MTDVTELPDSGDRSLIEELLGETLFVEAGAGSGKTHSLVERIVRLILNPDPIPLSQIAVITFTEKAAAELRHRIRIRLEKSLGEHHEESDRELAAEALRELDGAAVATLHGFALRILSEHPLEAGLPPNFETIDEISGQVVFRETFERFRDELFSDPEWGETLLLADALGIDTDRDFYALADALENNWDLLQRIEPPALPEIDFSGLVNDGEHLASRIDEHSGPGDRMTRLLEELREVVEHIAGGFDVIEQTAVLNGAGLSSGSRAGNSKYWPDIANIREEYESFRAAVEKHRSQLVDFVLRRSTTRLSNFILDEVENRRLRGRLNFHDLLVFARDLLSDPIHGSVIRKRVHAKYRSLLIDEFQDTDPLQIQIVTLVATSPDDPPQESWVDMVTRPGHLFFVGDPKQSIYRFRRADISLYMQAQQHHQSREIRLLTNFRSGPQIIAWINEVFGNLIQYRPGSQPNYEPLVANREAPPIGAGVMVLGSRPHPKRSKKTPDGFNMNEIRRVEAEEIAQTIIRCRQQGWSVGEEGSWRPAKFSDIAVLVPGRPSMPALEDAFENLGIPYRIASTTNVWRSREVRDLIMCLRAVDDPTDELATVSVLRSSIYGCGDDDLYSFKLSHDDAWNWNVVDDAEHHRRSANGDPVARGLAHLSMLHSQRTSLTPSQILRRIIRDRQMYEQCAARRNPRESLRRIRHVLDQARAWSDEASGTLQRFLLWVAQQSADNARPIEAILPENDDDSIRIMTIHGAKGLEFPICMVAGLAKGSTSSRGISVGYVQGVDAPTVRYRKGTENTDFAQWHETESAFRHDELVRTLYVACTRARDHLVVSLHRTELASSPTEVDKLHGADIIASGHEMAPQSESTPPTIVQGWVKEHQNVSYPPRLGRSEWTQVHQRAVTRSTQRVSLSATAIAKSGGFEDATNPGLEKDPEYIDAAPWNRGRYGTAVGRAVHAVLQRIDLVSSERLLPLSSVQAEVEGIPEQTETVVALVESALSSALVREAAQERHWREIYVASTIHGTVLEGYVDLVFETKDGLVIVDYKTDQFDPTEAAEKLGGYQLQAAAYALALGEATNQPVARVELVFLRAGGPAVISPVPHLDEVLSNVRAIIEREAEVGIRP